MFISSLHQTILIKVTFSLVLVGSVYVFSYTTFAQTVSTPVPEISSVMMEDEWYPEVMGTFEWELPAGVTAVAVGIATSTDQEPMFVYEPPVTEHTVEEEDVGEGIQYVSVQFKDANGWGDIAYHKLQIDRTPPNELFLDVVHYESDESPTLVFNSTDELSGIYGYVLTIASSSDSYFFTPERAQYGHPLSGMKVGKYPIVVTAYDSAGNSYTNSFPIFVTDYREATEDELVFGLFTKEETAMIGFSLVTILSLWFAVYTYRIQSRKSRKLRTEVYEVQEQMEKIFTALRNEIHEQVQSIRNRSRLTKNEKKVVENLDKALEVSNTLIDKEIVDVKEALK